VRWRERKIERMCDVRGREGKIERMSDVKGRERKTERGVERDEDREGGREKESKTKRGLG